MVRNCKVSTWKRPAFIPPAATPTVIQTARTKCCLWDESGSLVLLLLLFFSFGALISLLGWICRTWLRSGGRSGRRGWRGDSWQVEEAGSADESLTELWLAKHSLGLGFGKCCFAHQPPIKKASLADYEITSDAITSQLSFSFDKT